MPKPSPLSELVTTAEACVILAPKNGKPLDRSTVIRMVRENRLAYAHKMPTATGMYLFFRSDVEQLAAERRRGSAA